MFSRILRLQQGEYGPHDRRCYVTIDKINMVHSQGANFEQAIEELRKTFSMPETTGAVQSTLSDDPEAKEGEGQHSLLKTQSGPLSKGKGQKNKVFKVLNSMRKKKATASR